MKKDLKPALIVLGLMNIAAATFLYFRNHDLLFSAAIALVGVSTLIMAFAKQEKK